MPGLRVNDGTWMWLHWIKDSLCCLKYTSPDETECLLPKGAQNIKQMSPLCQFHQFFSQLKSVGGVVWFFVLFKFLGVCFICLFLFGWGFFWFFGLRFFLCVSDFLPLAWGSSFQDHVSRRILQNVFHLSLAYLPLFSPSQFSKAFASFIFLYTSSPPTLTRLCPCGCHFY